MFGLIFALIVSLIVLAVVSYGAYKMYLTIQKLVQENETLKKDHARAAQAAIAYCTLAEDIRSDLRAKSFQLMDVEKALDVALNVSLMENEKVENKGTIREFDLNPILKTIPEPELLFVGTMSNQNPSVLKASQIWFENLTTGERSDIASHVEFPAMADEEKFDSEFWKRLNPPYPIVDTIVIEDGGETLKALAQKIPGVEELTDWEKELRKNPDSYEELPRPKSRELAKPSDTEVTRILDGIFGLDKKND